MGKSNGLWCKLYESIWDHPKTQRAAAVLIEAGVHAAFAPSVVVSAFHRLTCWALRSGDDGETGALADGRLGTICWPEAAESDYRLEQRIGTLMRRALHAGGYLEGNGRDERLHEFELHNAKLIGDRLAKRALREAASNERRPTVERASSGRRCREEEEREGEEKLSLPKAESDDDPLLQDLLTAADWAGSPATMARALSQLRRRELADDEIRRRLQDLGSEAVGSKPFDLRDRLLAAGEPSVTNYPLPAGPDLESADDWQRKQAEADGMTVEERRQLLRETFYGNGGDAR